MSARRRPAAQHKAATPASATGLADVIGIVVRNTYGQLSAQDHQALRSTSKDVLVAHDACGAGHADDGLLRPPPVVVNGDLIERKPGSGLCVIASCVPPGAEGRRQLERFFGRRGRIGYMTLVVIAPKSKAQM